jgi:phage shock protein PspC (stress-responsive transcriptional regulator)
MHRNNKDKILCGVLSGIAAALGTSADFNKGVIFK